MPWSAPLTSPIKLKDGRVLVTLLDAAKLLASFLDKVQIHEWNVYAVKLLMKAAESGDTSDIVEEATAQAQRALFRDGML